MGCSRTLGFNVKHIDHYIQKINLKFIFKLLTCNFPWDKSSDVSNQKKKSKNLSLFFVLVVIFRKKSNQINWLDIVF